MKILAFSDTHLNKKAITNIITNSKNADILICAGDISWFGVGLDKILQLIDTKIKKPLFIIHGNHEDEKNLKDICKNLKNIHFTHKQSIKIENYNIFFYGGGGFAQKNPNFELAANKFKKDIKENEKIILVTHAPPYNTDLDYLEWAGHVGCKSIKEFLKETKPILHISGHIHENFNKHEILFKKTMIISPGPSGTILEI